jgi:hypothetical protein
VKAGGRTLSMLRLTITDAGRQAHYGDGAPPLHWQKGIDLAPSRPGLFVAYNRPSTYARSRKIMTAAAAELCGNLGDDV